MSIIATSLPTDNLYKFIALSSLAVVLLGNWFYRTEIEKIEIKEVSSFDSLMVGLREEQHHGRTAISNFRDSIDRDTARIKYNLEIYLDYTGYSTAGKELTKQIRESVIPTIEGFVQEFDSLEEEIHQIPTDRNFSSEYFLADKDGREKILNDIYDLEENYNEVYRKMENLTRNLDAMSEDGNDTWKKNLAKVMLDFEKSANENDRYEFNFRSNYVDKIYPGSNIVTYTNQNIKDLNERRLKNESIKHDMFVLRRHSRQLERYGNGLIFLNVIGGVVFLIGFTLWYYKLQRHYDREASKK